MISLFTIFLAHIGMLFIRLLRDKNDRNGGATLSGRMTGKWPQQGGGYFLFGLTETLSELRRFDFFHGIVLLTVKIYPIRVFRVGIALL